MLACKRNILFYRRFLSTRPSATFLPVDEVKDRVLAVIKSIPSAPFAVDANSHLVANLKFDSLQRKDLAVRLEAEFCVSAPQNFASNILGVPEIVKYFSEHPKAR